MDTSANAGKLLDAANEDSWHDGIGQNNLTSQLNKERMDNEIRSSPEEEFFSLSCLALKIKLIEQLQQDNQAAAADSDTISAEKNKDDYEVFNTISEVKLFRLC